MRAAADGLRTIPGDVTPLVEAALGDAGVLPAAWLLLAALCAGRPAPAPITLRVLLQVPEDDKDLAAVIAWGCPDRRALLLDLCGSQALMYSQIALFLFLAVEDLEGEAPPRALCARLRRWAREMEEPNRLLGLTIGSLADPGVRQVGDRHLLAGRSERAEREAARLRRLLQGPPLDVAPEQAPHAVSGFTVRREASTGRNDPCPCQSGKKYKRCCESRAAPRVSELSPVPGLTLAAYRARIAEFVPVEKFEEMTPDELLPIPLEHLPPAHLATAARRFLVFDRIEPAERALALLQARAAPEALVDDVRHHLLRAAFVLGRTDLVGRLVPQISAPLFRRMGDLCLALLTDASPVLGRLEELARDGLRDPGEDGVQLLMRMTERVYPALSLLFGRAALDPRRPREMKQIVTCIEQIRDELGLSPEDRFPFLLADKTRDAVGHMQELFRQQGVLADLERISTEAAALKEALAASQRRAAELEAELQRDAEARAEAARLISAARAEEERAQAEEREAEEERRRLLGKIDRLKALVAQGKEERAALRQRVAELEATTAADPRPAPPVPPPSRDEEAPEDGRWETDGYDGWRIVLTPVWTRTAHGALHDLPPHISREALVTIAQLAAGKPDAWRGAKRLKEVSPPLYEARVGLRYRGLFRVTEHSLEVLEIIHRKQLDLRLKQLYT